MKHTVVTFGLLLFAVPAYATEIVVTTFDDDRNTPENCSLRAAIMAARTNAPVDACPAGQPDERDVIILGEGLYDVEGQRVGGPETEDTDLDVFGWVEIRGAGAERTIIRGLGGDRIFQLHPDSDVIIRDLTLTGGHGRQGEGGGALLSQGLTLIEDVVMRDNQTEGSRDERTGMGAGGAIYVGSGQLTLRRCLIADNQAQGGHAHDVAPANNPIDEDEGYGGGGGGGGIGGAIFNARHAVLRIYNSTLTSNRVRGGHGGAIQAGLPGNTQSPGGGPGGAAGDERPYEGFGFGQDGSSLGGGGGGGGPPGAGGDGAFGGGGGASGLHWNNAFVGEGGWGGGDVRPDTDPQRGGGGAALGGAIFDDGGWVTLDHVTITENMAVAGTGAEDGQSIGAGVFTRFGSIEMRNTIIAGNHATAGVDCPNCIDCGSFGGALDSLGYNIAGDNTGCPTAALDISTSQLSLEYVTSNGSNSGYIPTSQSPALNAGSCIDSDGESVNKDQRGLTRGEYSLCDIGAFEAQVSDDDPWLDTDDNCPTVDNPEQLDRDADGIGDACDVCPDLAVHDGLDSDNDGIPNACDNCPDYGLSTDQSDLDGDGFGDVCDVCPALFDPDQSDSNGDGQGDACASDRDSDGVDDTSDNCPDITNPEQVDTNGDGRGDACELSPVPPDLDQDGIADADDNCPAVANPKQTATNNSGRGDACYASSMAEASGCRNASGSQNGLWLLLGAVLFVHRRRRR